MKKTPYLLCRHRNFGRGIGILFFSFLLFSAISCDKDDDSNTQNPIDLLPPATQVGANTAGCLVNGEAFLPNNGSVIPLVLNYLDNEDFSLIISNGNNGVTNAILIFIENVELSSDTTYGLNTEFGADASSGEYIINSEPSPSENYYSTNTQITGELTITNFDFDNAILSGTFWFDAINSEGTIVEVREGRFDMEY